MKSPILRSLLGLAAATTLSAPAGAFEVAEIRGDFYYDAQGELLAVRHVDPGEQHHREPRSFADKFAAMGIQLPAPRAQLQARKAWDKPATVPMHENSIPHLLVVKFRDDQPVRLRNGVLNSLGRSAAPAAQSVLASFPEARVERVFTTDEAILDSDRVTGQLLSGRELADLNNYYRVVLPEGADGAEIAEAFRALDEVETLYFETAPAEAPACVDISPATPDWEASQTYLDPAPAGMDIEYAWAYHTGGDGNPGFWVVDVEYAWCYNHEDQNVDSGDVLNGIATGIYETPDHGSAVLSIIGACDNGYGLTGIAHDVTMKMSDVDNAGIAAGINTAAAALLPGEVLLIEQQVGGPSGELLPVEWVQANFDAIAAADALGLIVIEAAANGSVNLDDPAYGGLFNSAVRHSGAIMVGAGDLNNNVSWFSNYGSRVDMHAHGSSVYAAGYGVTWSGAGCEQDYTSGFGGTSSASALITGAAASLQGIANSKYGIDLTRAQLRSSLRYGGTPQGTPTGNNIGPMPDMVQAINEIEPDVRPYTPAGWSSPLVPRQFADATQSSATLAAAALVGGSTTYVNWAQENNPGAYTSLVNAPNCELSISGVAEWIGIGMNLAPGGWGVWVNWPVNVKGGRHNLEMVCDYSFVEDEWIETNNTHAMSAIWTGLPMAQDVPVYRSHDPVATAGTYVYYNAEGLQLANLSGYWNVAAVMPDVATDDFDIRLNTETPSNIPLAGFGASVASSFSAAGEIAFVGWDENEVGTATNYASVLNFSGTGLKLVEYDADGGTIPGGTAQGPYSMNAGDIVEIYEVWLTAGQSYRVHVGVQSGTADLGLSVIDGTTGYFSKTTTAPGGFADYNGGGADEWVLIKPPADDFYGIVVWKARTADIDLTSTYTVTVSTNPNLIGSRSPSGWTHPVTPRNSGGASVLFADLPAVLTGNSGQTYYNFSTYNEGANQAVSPWQTWLYEDGYFRDSLNGVTVNQGAFVATVNQGPYNVGGGRHHVTTVADAFNQVVEFDETDNSFTDWFVWSPDTLTAEIPRTEPAPPYATPSGWGPYYGAAGYRSSTSGFWTAVAVTPQDPAADFDVRVHTTQSTGSKDGFGAWGAFSNGPAGLTEYVLVNHNVVSGTNFDFGVLNFAPSSASFTLAQAGSNYLGTIQPGISQFTRTMPADDPIDLFEVWLDPAVVGGTVYISVANRSAADLNLAAFDGGTAYHDPLTATAWSNTGGPGGDEHLAAIVIPTADYYAIVVNRNGARDRGAAAAYELVISTGASATDTPQIAALPTEFALAAPSPNPLRNTAAIRFDVPADSGHLRVAVYDLTGRRVATLADGARAAGRHSVDWDGRDAGGRRVAAGIYFVRLETAGHQETRKITVLR